MAIKNLDTSVDIISQLPDTPTSPDYDAQSLKNKFDEGANIIKEYINDSLIPDIKDEFAEAALGEGGYKYMPIRRLLVSYTEEGTYTFSTDEYPSCNGLYDLVLIGGGGGGYKGTISTGGGGGSVTNLERQRLSGVYTVTVGRGGGQTLMGMPTYMVGEGNIGLAVAAGGQCTNSDRKIALSGGIGGGSSEYGDGSLWYGKGGDCYGYGRGVIGGLLNDDIIPARGYGGGGWGEVPGSSGAVFVYGYAREDE